MPIAHNVLARQFNPAAANVSWVADITYIRTRSGWLYLAAVMDLFSRKIVGWAMADRACLPNWCVRPCGWPSTTQSSAWADRAFRRWHSVRHEPTRTADPFRPSRQHEPQRQLLGQRRHGALLPESEMDRVWQRDYATMLKP